MDDALHAVIPDPLDASDAGQKKGRKISRKLLINKLNYINFQDGSILVHFTHRKYNSKRTVSALPHPCRKNQLYCLWHQPLDFHIADFDVTGFSLVEGHMMIFVPAENPGIYVKGIQFDLPESCFEFNQRKTPRHLPKKILVKLLQNGAVFEGTLADFSVFSFRVTIAKSSPQNTQWLNVDAPVTAILSNDSDVVYSGECQVLKRNQASQEALVLKPVNNQVSRFKSKC